MYVLNALLKTALFAGIEVVFLCALVLQVRAYIGLKSPDTLLRYLNFGYFATV
jgi:hypothetical protein